MRGLPRKPTFYLLLHKNLGDVINRLPDEVIWDEGDLKRDDPDLVNAVEELGEQANTAFSKLKVVEIPNNVEWEICDYNGMESVHEGHRSWC